MRKRKKIKYTERVNNLLKKSTLYHRKYYSEKIFGGPSLYFHKKALIKSEQQYEYIYAALTSWGMHRLGKGGAKMTDFDTFKTSLKAIKSDVKRLRNKRLENLKEKEFMLLEKVFKSIKVMKTKTKIVGNSKVMAHLLPKLVPPIDREYTFHYLMRSKSIANDIDKEWVIYKTFIREFFQKIACDKKFKRYSKKWLKNKKKYP